MIPQPESTQIVPHWYVVQTKVRHERVARDNLRHQNYNTYLPMIRTVRRRGRRAMYGLEPLFAGYIFVQLDLTRQSVTPVQSTRGVQSLVRFGERICPVPNEVIDGLAKAHDGNEEVPIDPVSLFRNGDPVDFLDGPFSGARGIFQGKTGSERVSVLLTILGQQRKVVVPAQLIAPAAS